MVRQHILGQRHAVIGALFGFAVVAEGVEQRGFGEERLLRLHHIADIDQFIVPGMQRNDLGRVVDHDIRHDAGLHRRDDLLPLRRERRDAEVDLVAAGLFIIGGDLLDRGVLFRHEALRPPYFRCLRLRVGDIRAGERTGSDQRCGRAKD